MKHVIFPFVLSILTAGAACAATVYPDTPVTETTTVVPGGASLFDVAYTFTPSETMDLEFAISGTGLLTDLYLAEFGFDTTLAYSWAVTPGNSLGEATLTLFLYDVSSPVTFYFDNDGLFDVGLTVSVIGTAVPVPASAGLLATALAAAALLRRRKEKMV